MNNGLKVVGGVMLILVMAACSGTFTIYSDYDKASDFSTYKTFNFLPGADSIMGPGSRRIKTYTEEYMVLLGYVKADKPDIFVSINGKVEQRTGVTTTSGPGYGGYGGYYGGYYGWNSYTSTYVYNQTTIVIDLVDVKKHQLVWQGAATGEFDQYSMKDKKMHEMVDHIFGQYPFVAGSSEKRVRLYDKYYQKPKAN